MLSATGVEPAPFEATGVVIGSFTSSGFTLDLERDASPKLVREGGYLSIGDADGFDVAEVLPSFTPTESNSTPSTNGSSQNFGSFDLFGESPYRIEILPVRFLATLANAELSSPGLNSLSESSAISRAHVSEGGPIPIEPLRMSEGALAAESQNQFRFSIAQSVASQNARASHNAITGESARAMVFEMAGGEPGDHAQYRPAETKTSVQGDRTTSTSVTAVAAPVGANGETANLDRGPAATQRDGDPELASSQASYLSAMRHTVEKLGRLGPHRSAADHQQAGLQLSSSDSQIAPLAKFESTQAEAMLASDDPAFLMAFEQFGSSPAVAPPLSVAESVLQKSLAVTPLLVVWALERISANSRRAAKSDPIVATTRPRRWPTIKPLGDIRR